jgi:poly-gamma-glutamate synthesis protein (capsule biosynthesis protein)
MSIHWGGNWGYQIPPAHRHFAHRLVDEVGVDIVHGHSSHHPMAIEVYRDRPILYGCGDFINDYEGIRGYEEFRSDLVLGYFVSMNPDAATLDSLVLTPFQLRQLRLNRATRDDRAWLSETLTREGRPLGTAVLPDQDDSLELRWG